jgi:16S rRNA (guanine(966)-N(2))-methyltransferase RsmD
MRIIGGEHRGRTIKMPKTGKARPTQDRVREAVFNIIREKVPGSKVLDLYAGSGAFGIEALSRGAQSAIFVDNNINCIRAIKSNLSSVDYRAPLARVFKNEAVKAIAALKEKGAAFDIIFLDPPYNKASFDKLRISLAKNCLIKIAGCDILSQHGFVVAEHFVKDILPEETGTLSLVKRRKYGDTVVSFYQKKGLRIKD